MSEPVLSAHDAIRWNEATTEGWRKLLAEHPEILSLGCDVARTSTVAQLLQHIVAVEVRFAERLLGLPQTEYSTIPYDTAEGLFRTHDRAMTLMRQALDTDLDWDKPLVFTTRIGGEAEAAPKTIFFHAIFHGIRHYAQLTTLARQNGYKIDGPGDYLLMGVTWAPPPTPAL